MNGKAPCRHGENFGKKNLLGCNTRQGKAVVCKEVCEVRQMGLNLNGLKNGS